MILVFITILGLLHGGHEQHVRDPSASHRGRSVSHHGRRVTGFEQEQAACYPANQDLVKVSGIFV